MTELLSDRLKKLYFKHIAGPNVWKAMAEEMASHEVPDGLLVGKCARCGKPVLIPRDDPENDQMECCAKCVDEINRATTDGALIDVRKLETRVRELEAELAPWRALNPFDKGATP